MRWGGVGWGGGREEQPMKDVSMYLVGWWEGEEEGMKRGQGGGSAAMGGLVWWCWAAGEQAGCRSSSSSVSA